jgi:hypothetical protein
MGRKRKTDPAVLADAIAKIKSGEWKLQEAADRCGIAVSAMSVAARRSDGIPLASAAPAVEDKSDLDVALEAAGGSPETPTPPEGPTPPAGEKAPGISDADYCVQIVGTIKRIGVLGGGMLSGVSPLDDRLGKLGEMSKDFRKATEVASPQLAPILKKWFPDVSLLLGFAIAAMFEGLGAWMGVKDLSRIEKEKRLAKAKETPPVKSAEAVAKQAADTNGSVNREPWLKNIKDPRRPM